MPTPREALDEFSSQVRHDFESWYDRHARHSYQWYLGLQLVVFASSVGAAIIASLSSGANFDRWAKYVIVILPLFNAAAATVLSQFRLYDLWQLREQGRIQVQAIALEARRRSASAENDQECSAIHEDLEKRLNEIEITQSKTFFGLYKSDFLLRIGGPLAQKHRNKGAASDQSIGG